MEVKPVLSPLSPYAERERQHLRDLEEIRRVAIRSQRVALIGRLVAIFGLLIVTSCLTYLAVSLTGR
jgi:hypothetical protein